ncbi:TlpA family protein disulfide reductase [Sunxiuqinia indica]|uniref:TlpA family protein disulfide reductase n=1 Tax=Sunxiuqinia indica TaxID=2692584 RepID=UPI00135B6F4E|nr:TlpA disulfide reductase family protein [Sunxiuqinia indica]
MSRKFSFSFTLNLIVFVCLICSITNANAQETRATRLSGLESPEAGATLHLIYSPQGGPLETYDDIYAIVYLFQDYDWKMQCLHPTLKNGVFNIDFQMPENCGFVALKFLHVVEGGDPIADNNNDRGFVTTVLKNGSVVAGGNLAWGIFRMPALGKAPYGYFKEFTISNDALEFWTKKEVQDHSEELPKFLDIFLAVAKECTGDKYPAIANSIIDQFLSETAEPLEENYMQIRNCYRFELKDTVRADAMDQLIAEKFPNGQDARFNAYADAYMNPGADQQAKLEDFLAKFPFADWKVDWGAGQQGYMYDKVYQALATAYFESDETDKLLALLPDMNFSTIIDTWHWTVDRSYKMKLKSLPQIYQASTAMLNELEAKLNDNSYAQAFSATPWVLENHTRDLLDKKLGRQIEILNDLEKYELAPAYLAKISSANKYTNTSLNDAYVHVLQQVGTEAELSHFLENTVRVNAVSPEMDETLKMLYLKRNSNGDYNAYIASLKDTKAQKAFVEELKNSLVKIPYEAFELSGPNGIHVNSKDFKDKIVVIDFWATWCTPCKKAFPGMQLAVNEYANDNHVDFYFMSTLEVTPDFKEKSEAYLKENGFKFQQLFDEPNDRNGKLNKVFFTFSTIFNSSGIPRKVILKDGYIRYTAEGYLGSPSKLYDELKTVIDLLKAEN